MVFRNLKLRNIILLIRFNIENLGDKDTITKLFHKVLKISYSRVALPIFQVFNVTNLHYTLTLISIPVINDLVAGSIFFDKQINSLNNFNFEDE